MENILNNIIIMKSYFFPAIIYVLADTLPLPVTSSPWVERQITHRDLESAKPTCCQRFHLLQIERLTLDHQKDETKSRKSENLEARQPQFPLLHPAE
jgi:hypothetical protein